MIFFGANGMISTFCGEGAAGGGVGGGVSLPSPSGMWDTMPYPRAKEERTRSGSCKCALVLRIQRNQQAESVTQSSPES